MVSVAEKNAILVAPSLFVRTVWIIARPPRLGSLNVAHFSDVEAVVSYQLVGTPGKSTDVAGLRKKTLNR